MRVWGTRTINYKDSSWIALDVPNEGGRYIGIDCVTLSY